MDGEHPCSLLYNNWVEKGIAKNAAIAAYDEATALLAACIVENGPLPENETPLRQISESEILSETEDQRTLRMALETIRRQLEIVRRTKRK